MKVAIVHEYVTKLGGAERVLSSLLEIYPKADVFCLMYDKSLVEKKYKGVKFFGSRLQGWGWLRRKFFRIGINRLTKEIERFDLSEYDLVICSSNSFAHGVVTNTDCLHVVYYHSPARFLWDWKNEYLEEKGWTGWKSVLVDFLRKPVREWDYLAAQRSDVVIANSENVQKRIKKYYRRDSEVIYPPVEVDRFEVSDEVGDYYLIVSTLTRYKRIDLAVNAFKKLGEKLKVVGDGSDREYLERLAKGDKNIEFLGFRPDEEVAKLMKKCKGLIFCSEEDFGITPVETMASGRPVFGYGKGGLLETVIDGKTGILFEEQDVENFVEKFNEFKKWLEKDFDSKNAVKAARKFRKEIFKEKIEEVVNREKKNQVNI